MTTLLSKTARLSLGALAALPLLAGLGAQAQTARIDVSDLDLSKPAQAAVMDVRIERAADRYCGGLDVQDLARRDACRAAFKAAAVEQIRDYRLQQDAARATKPGRAG